MQTSAVSLLIAMALSGRVSTSLYRERDGVMRKEVLRGLQGVTIRNLLRAADGSLWVGTEGWGVFRLNASAIEHYTTHEGGLSNDFVRVMLQDRDGSVWVGTDGELNHIVAGRVTILHLPSSVSVMALLQDRNSATFGSAASPACSSCMMDTGSRRRSPPRCATLQSGHCIRTPDETIWVGTNRGLYREDGNAITAVNTAQGYRRTLSDKF